MTTDPETTTQATETTETAAPAAPVVAPTDDKIAEAKAEWAEKGRQLAFLKAQGKDEEAEALEKSMPAKPGEKPAEKPAEPEPDDTQAVSKADDAAQVEARRAAMVARQALERDGWDAEDIEGLKPEKLVSLGEKARKRQAAADALGAKAARAIREAKAKNEPKDDTQPESAEPARTPLDELLDELDKGETPERKAEEAPEPVASTRAVPAELAKAREELHRTRVLLAEREVLNEFPGLKDPAHRRAVAAEMEVLDPTGSALDAGHEAVASVLRKAAYIVFGKELKQQADQTRRDRAQRARAVVAGQPDVESRPAVNPRTLTADQIRKAAFDASTEPDASLADTRFKELVGRAPKRR